jgi:exopolysaccharide biosynthesis polyprenyl glycosylphosphotransferase
MVAVGPVVVMSLIAQRWFFWRIGRRLRAARGRETTVLIFGAGGTGRLVAQHLAEEHVLGMRAVGFLDDDPAKRGEMIRASAGVRGEKLEVFGGEEHLSEVLRQTGATAVFLAMPSASSSRNAHLAAVLEREGVQFFLVPSAGALLFSTLSFGQLGGLPVFARRSVQITRMYLVANRLLDLVGAASILLVSLPVLIVSALCIRLTSPGPVFFRQTRVGRYGAPFVIWKLRTMHSDSPKYAIHPEGSDDPRITIVGRWLRRLSIDELPQLWNVIRGEMSLVGPRPEMPFIAEDYGEIETQRLSVKPGVTGLWQISADRAFKINDNIHYDVYYVENRSFTLDLAILLLTPFALLPGGRTA